LFSFSPPAAEFSEMEWSQTEKLQRSLQLRFFGSLLKITECQVPKTNFSNSYSAAMNRNKRRTYKKLFLKKRKDFQKTTQNLNNVENFFILMQLDEKDFRILDVLRNEARDSISEISKKTGIPITTVYNRLQRMEQDGIIKGYSAVLDYEKLGLGVLAYILINISYSKHTGQKIDQESIAKKIRSLENVSEVSIITGESDMIVKVRTKSISQLNNFILKKLRNIEGIDKVVTMIALSSF